MANILGINLSESSAAESLQSIKNFWHGAGQHYVVTPNPEIILASHDDEELFYILNKADLALADGFGLQIAAALAGSRLARVTGADMTVSLLEAAAQENISVAILNWDHGLSTAEQIRQVLREKYPRLAALVLDLPRGASLTAEAQKSLNDFAPQMLFCAWGSPYQEKIIFHELNKWPSVRVALGIGGSFDFLTGAVKRAPAGWRRIGLEWLWRLIQQPRRYRRIFRATVVFMTKVLRARFINHLLYRPNVACLIYRNTARGKEIFIVKREDDADHWQLPQGGTDGEDPLTAGQREIWEETGIKNIAVKGLFKNIYRYDFKGGLRKGSYKHQPGYQARRYKFDYRGQKQSLLIVEFLGQEEEIKINFWDHSAWKFVPADQLISSVHPLRRPGAEIFMKKFNSLKL